MKYSTTVLALVLVLQYRIFDAPVCIMLDQCQSQYSYELLVNGELPVTETWSVSFRQQLRSGTHAEAPPGHVTPVWGNLGGGITYRLGAYSVSLIATSAHYFDRDQHAGKRTRFANYVEVKGVWE